MRKITFGEIILIATVILSIAIIVLFGVNTYLNESRKVVDATQELQQQTDDANFVFRNLKYIKDLRTNLCFTWWDPTFVVIPCETIPPQLLIAVDPTNFEPPKEQKPCR